MQKRFQVFERIDKDGSGQLTLEDLIEGVAVLVGFKPLASVWSPFDGPVNSQTGDSGNPRSTVDVWFGLLGNCKDPTDLSVNHSDLIVTSLEG